MLGYEILNLILFFFLSSSSSLPHFVSLFHFTGKSRICLPDYFYSRDIFEDYSIWIIATS